jgi:hypothetical protein
MEWKKERLFSTTNFKYHSLSKGTVVKIVS